MCLFSLRSVPKYPQHKAMKRISRTWLICSERMNLNDVFVEKFRHFVVLFLHSEANELKLKHVPVKCVCVCVQVMRHDCTHWFSQWCEECVCSQPHTHCQKHRIHWNKHFVSSEAPGSRFSARFAFSSVSRHMELKVRLCQRLCGRPSFHLRLKQSEVRSHLHHSQQDDATGAQGNSRRCIKNMSELWS